MGTRNEACRQSLSTLCVHWWEARTKTRSCYFRPDGADLRLEFLDRIWDFTQLKIASHVSGGGVN